MKVFLSAMSLLALTAYVANAQETQRPIPAADEVLTMSLQKSGTPTSKSFGRMITSFPVLKVFTVCYRIRLNRFREESTLMSYAVSESKDNELRMDHRQSGYKVSVHSTWAKTDIITPLQYWSHYCLVYDNGENRWRIYQNGVKEAEGKMPRFSGVLEGNGAYIIGQEQDSFGGGFQRDQSYSGEITELNFWHGELSDEKINDLATCESVEGGSALSWNETEWSINGEVEWVVRKRASVCSTKKRTSVFFGDRFNLKQAIKLCQVVGGNISVPQNEVENSNLYETTKKYAGHCSGYRGTSYLWLGAHDNNVEGRWDHWDSGNPIKFQGKWRGDGPNGGTVENCMVMLYDTFPGRWSDMACLDSYSFCVPCEFERFSTMYLKGGILCKTSPFNTEYLLLKDIEGKPTLTGYLHSDIYWENATQAWVLSSRKEKALARWVPSRPDEYPFGKKTWTTDYDVCGYEKGDEVLLNLSVCGEGEYTCDDGSCIDLSKKCDLRVDCADTSDETSCTLLDIQEGYKVTIPPPPVNPNSPLPVNISVSINSFPVIKTQELVFETNLKLKLSWQDLRLNYLNLKEERSLNLLSPDDVRKIWTPTVFFSNANGNLFSNLNQGSRVECVSNSDSIPGGPELADEVNIFSGETGALEMSQLYTAVYSCDFNLLMFPFDAQDCQMIFTLTSAASSYMELVPDIGEYVGSKELIEYTIGEVITIDQTVVGDFSQVRVGVRFQRRSGFYLLTLYIPTVLLVSIAYFSMFFNPIDFNSRIVVALTSLLVLSSLFTQTSNSLPKTSYFKLVDIWLFSSIVIIFVIISFQTLVEYFSFDRLIGSDSSDDDAVHLFKVQPVPAKTNNESILNRLRSASILKGKKSSSKTPTNIKILIFGRIAVPSIFFIFNLVYWSIALRYVLGLEELKPKIERRHRNLPNRRMKRRACINEITKKK